MGTRWWIAVGMVLVAAAPASAFVARAGDVVAVGEAVRDDLYVAGGTVTVTGPVEGDVVAAGGSVAVESAVSGGVLAAGGNLRVRGPVTRTVRAAGGTVSVRSSVGADAVLAGGTVTVEREARVGRDLVAAGGTVYVYGEVARHARLGGGTVTVGGRIAQDVWVDADRIVVLPTARIGGTLRYRSDAAAEVQPGARIDGGVVRESAARPPGVVPGAARFPWARHLLEGVWLLSLGLVTFAVLPQASARITEQAGRVGRSLAVGSVLLVTVPVASVLLLLTVVAVPVGLVALALYAVTLYAGQVFAARRLGEALLRRLGQQTVSPYWAGAVGTLALVVLFALPWVGWLARLAAVLVGLGAVWLAAYGALGRSEPAPAPPGGPRGPGLTP